MTGNSENASDYSPVKRKIITALKLHLLVLTLSASAFASQDFVRQAAVDPSFNAGVTNSDALIYVAKPLANGKLLVGGTFTTANGMPFSYLVRLNSDGSIDNTFNSGGLGLNGSAYDLAIQADGKVLVAGTFTAYNGVTQNRLVRINADGSRDTTFNSSITGTNPYVNKITLQSDGKILISGNFAGSIIRLNADGSIDTSFTTPFNTSSYLVEEIVVQNNGSILIGGIFSGGIARLNPNGSIDSAFSTTEQFGEIYAITILSDGKILIGGDFTFSGITAPSTKRLNPDGSTDSSFSTGAANAFNKTENFAIQTDGKILTAGHFTNDVINTLAVLRLNADGSSDNLFSIPTGNGKSQHVSLQSDGKILLSGEFSLINGQSKPGIVRLNTDGTIDNSFNASFYGNSLVQSTIQQPDGKILVGGNFNFANGTTRSNITRFNIDGTLDNSFNSGTGLISDYKSGSRNLFDTELQSDGKILLAGIFYGYNGVPRRGIVRLNSDGTVDPSFEAQISGGLIWVFDILLLPDGKILASTFTTDPVTGFGYDGLIKLNSDGSSANSFTAIDGVIRKIARQQDGKIIIGGSLAYVGGNSFNRIARLNADGSIDSTFNIGSGFNGSVLDIIIQPDGKILVGGTFTFYNGTARNRIVRLNADGSLDTSFNPGSGADSAVYKLALEQNGKIFLGGNFNSLNGVNRNRLGRLNTDGSIDTTFESGFDNTSANTVRSLLVQTDGKLVLGGFFSNYNGVPRNSIARLSNALPPSTMFDFDGDRKTDISIFRASTNQWWYLRSSDLSNRVFQFGSDLVEIVPADYTGDGKTDIAVWKVATGEWFILRSEDGSFYSFPFGRSGDRPMPADYDGDGKTDAAVFRPSSGTWFINKSSGGTITENFGINGDVPVAADYDGDGKADIAIYRISNGQWWINRSSSGLIVTTFGGLNRDVPVQADYTGDGKTDVAFFRASTNEWFVLRSENSTFYSVPFGTAADIPTPGDYDGDGKSDFAVFRPSNNTWYLQQSTSGFTAVVFGTTNDIPVPSAYVR